MIETYNVQLSARIHYAGGFPGFELPGFAAGSKATVERIGLAGGPVLPGCVRVGCDASGGLSLSPDNCTFFVQAISDLDNNKTIGAASDWSFDETLQEWFIRVITYDCDNSVDADFLLHVSRAQP